MDEYFKNLQKQVNIINTCIGVVNSIELHRKKHEALKAENELLKYAIENIAEENKEYKEKLKNSYIPTNEMERDFLNKLAELKDDDVRGLQINTANYGCYLYTKEGEEDDGIMKNEWSYSDVIHHIKTEKKQEIPQEKRKLMQDYLDAGFESDIVKGLFNNFTVDFLKSNFHKIIGIKKKYELAENEYSLLDCIIIFLKLDPR